MFQSTSLVTRMTLLEMEQEITQAVEKLSESVVSIESTKYARSRRYGNMMPIEGAGSGLILDSSGHIVTNNHVVESADIVRISLKDGRTLKGQVLGSDPATDIAVIETEGNSLHDLPQAILADSDHLKVGQFALAIGNSLGLPGGHTVSLGVVSALGRPLPGADFIFEGFIQTDSAVNPGNSGGPLANLKGEAIGITTAIIPFANGVGFAIPINIVRTVADQILSKGRVVRPWLGISAVDVSPPVSKKYGLGVDRGVLIVDISPYGPAAEAGLRQGDVIMSIGGLETRRMKDLLSVLSKHAVGQAAALSAIRNGHTIELSVRLLEMPTKNEGSRRRIIVE
jgi:serine protease Do